MQADRREPWDQVLGGWISPLRFFDPEFRVASAFQPSPPEVHERGQPKKAVAPVEQRPIGKPGRLIPPKRFNQP